MYNFHDSKIDLGPCSRAMTAHPWAAEVYFVHEDLSLSSRRSGDSVPIGSFNSLFSLPFVCLYEWYICGRNSPVAAVWRSIGALFSVFVIQWRGIGAHHPCYFLCFSRMSATSVGRNFTGAAAWRGIGAFSCIVDIAVTRHSQIQLHILSLFPMFSPMSATSAGRNSRGAAAWRGIGAFTPGCPASSASTATRRPHSAAISTDIWQRHQGS